MRALEPQPYNIPHELKQIDAWAVWRYDIDDRGHESKPPFQARNPLERAWPSQPETWATFDEAYDCFTRNRGELNGISFALCDWGIVGIDLDHVSEHLEAAAQVVEHLDSYTEITPGKDGFRVFVHGYLPPGRRVRLDGVCAIEVYQAKRFLTVTGHRIERFPSVLQDRQLQLERVWSEFVSYVAA